MRDGYSYYRQAGALNRELKHLLGSDLLKELHHKQPGRHFTIAARQLALLVGCPLLIYHVPHWWVRLPAAVLMGFVVFSFTILLHEAVHKCIFNRDRRNLTPKLGFLYGTLSGLSPSQFTRWHMDHHNNLGTTDDDPKRAHLSPKRNARWYKFLYMTPALFPIYFRAAKAAQARYPESLRKRIAVERRLSMGLHIAWLITAWLIGGPAYAWWASIFPVFFVFPFAFTLNRLGQHYVTDPDDVAKWSTLMPSNGFWNFIYLYSSLHLEHHYFPAVPFYKLPRLQKALGPFFEARGVPSLTYARLLKLWFVDNHVPHTNLVTEQPPTPVNRRIFAKQD
ncbi:MAG: fatty acid desaturase [Acidobacteriota bacterium]|nr:fatty acid desaturase [Acidobacteriota bacterium]